jgi:hypothetical protein
VEREGKLRLGKARRGKARKGVARQDNVWLGKGRRG